MPSICTLPGVLQHVEREQQMLSLCPDKLSPIEGPRLSRLATIIIIPISLHQRLILDKHGKVN